MDRNIHFLGTDIDSARFSDPLVKDELPVDKVVIFHEENLPKGETDWDHAWKRIEETLNEFDIATETVSFSADEYWGFEHSGFITKLYRKLDHYYRKGDELYVNISSEPYQMNYSLLYAVWLLQLGITEKKPIDEEDTAANPIWDRIHLYVTNGEPHHFDITTQFYHMENAIRSVEDTVERQRNVLSEVNNLLSRFDAETELQADLDEHQVEINKTQLREFISESDGNSISNRVAELESDITDFLSSYNELQHHANQLRTNRLLMELSNHEMDQLFNNRPVANMLNRLVTSVNGEERSTIDEKSQGPVMLTTGELEELEKAMTEMELRVDDIDDGFTLCLPESWRSTLDEQGRAGPGRVVSVPSQPNGSPNNTEIAILFTLGIVESTASITELLDEMIEVAYQLNQGPGVMLESSLDDEQITDLREAISPSIRSKIQYNVNQLEGKGYLTKEKRGRANAIHPTDNALIWLASQGYNDFSNVAEPIEIAFSDISAKVNAELTD